KDVGYMGSDYYETPHIDRLASQGMQFTNAYSNAPNCAPTRACLMSGQYSPRHGVYTVGNPARGNTKLRKLVPTPNDTTLNGDIVTLAESLAGAGYVSASMGKWHLGNDPELGPVGQGFDVNIAGDEHGHPPAGYFAPYELPNVENAPEDEYLTDRLTDEAVEFIKTNQDRPFFLYLPHYSVHLPLHAKEKIIEKYRNKPASGGHNNPTYAAMIESTDYGIGRIMDTLESLGLEEDTVVVFTSDNGGHGNVTTMDPLRGSKGEIYEGGIRVPLAVKYPGHVAPGTQSDEPVISLDFYPTLLEWADADSPENQVLDGRSLVPLLEQREDSLDRYALYWHFPAYLQPYNRRQFPWRISPCSSIRKGDWKLIEFFEYGTLELYNLAEDIGETNNLSEDMPEKTKELLTDLRAWREQIHAPVPTEPNPDYAPEEVTIDDLFS
ncbi:MAG: sulfatase-like hydrolase/transferase, partial [Candidatus Marinimicrobia bacterium]|nr:sulfatase-like hydrolase/transferase [Candidatus Neomarinimicrobiota bacterium]